MCLQNLLRQSDISATFLHIEKLCRVNRVINLLHFFQKYHDMFETSGGYMLYFK